MTPTDMLEIHGFNRLPELARICRYITLTDANCGKKDLYSDDLKELFLLGQESVFDCIILSYLYGQAKGFRTCQELNRENEH